MQSYIRDRIEVMANGCWEWALAIGNHGYGVSRMGLSHRLAYEAFIGPIPHRMLVLHRCDNRRCCNPDHLFLGTHQDNSQDALAKGRLILPPPKLTDEQVREIRERLCNGETQQVLATEYKVSQAQISRINTHLQRNYTNG